MTLRRSACGADPEFVSALHSRVEVYFEVVLIRFQASAVCTLLVVPGTMDVDSSALFYQRIGELGIQLLADAFASCGWTTLGRFAFAVQAGQGGMVPEDVFTVKVWERLCPSTDGVESEHAAAVRRLWFEGQVVTMSDLRRQTSRVEDDAPKRISLPEREDRKARLQKKCNHLRLKGHLDPADSIINKFLNMLEINAPRWVSCEQCPSFTQEQQSDVKGNEDQVAPRCKGCGGGAQSSS